MSIAGGGGMKPNIYRVKTVNYLANTCLWRSINERLFDSTDDWLLKLTSTAIAALLLELGALVFLFISKPPIEAEKMTID